jgi:hypothetical protein
MRFDSIRKADLITETSDLYAVWPRWNPPVLELSTPLTEYLAGIIVGDLGRWDDGTIRPLDRADATALALYLADHLHQKRRPQIPSAASTG